MIWCGCVSEGLQLEESSKTNAVSKECGLLTELLILGVRLPPASMHSV